MRGWGLGIGMLRFYVYYQILENKIKIGYVKILVKHKFEIILKKLIENSL